MPRDPLQGEPCCYGSSYALIYRLLCYLCLSLADYFFHKEGSSNGGNRYATVLMYLLDTEVGFHNEGIREMVAIQGGLRDVSSCTVESANLVLCAPWCKAHALEWYRCPTSVRLGPINDVVF